MGKESGTTDEPRRLVRWDESEWCTVLAAALPVAATDKLSIDRAIAQVQASVLPRTRLRKHNVIYMSVLKGTHKDALRKVKTMSEADRVALMPQRAKARHIPRRDSPAPTEERIARMPGDTLAARTLRASYRGGFHWTDYEWALVVREADRMQAAGEFVSKRNGGECRRVIEAQDNVLPVSRRRAIEGLKKDYYGTGTVKRDIARIRPILADILAQDMPASLALAFKHDTPPPSTSPATATTPDSAQSVPLVAAAAADPNAGRDDVPRVSPHALKFATAMAYAVDNLLTEHTQAVVAQVEATITATLDTRLAALGDALAANVSQRVAGDIQNNLARVVHLLMESELGPIPAPAAHTLNGHGMNGHDANGNERDDDPPHPQDDEPARPRRVSLDVVGLTGSPETIIRKAVQEAYPNLDMRFVEPKRGDKVSFRPNVIVATKFISHSTEQRIRQQSANYVRVTGAAQSVIAAVHQLMGAHEQGAATQH